MRQNSLNIYDSYIVGQNIRTIRKENNMSVLDLSEAIGKSEDTINKVEQGIRNLTIKTLVQVANALETDANTILGFSVNVSEFEHKINSLEISKRKQCTEIFNSILDSVAKEK